MCIQCVLKKSSMNNQKIEIKIHEEIISIQPKSDGKANCQKIEIKISSKKSSTTQQKHDAKSHSKDA